MNFPEIYAKHQVLPASHPGKGFHWLMGATYHAILADPDLSEGNKEILWGSANLHLRLEAHPDRIQNSGFTNGFNGIMEEPPALGRVELWVWDCGEGCLVRKAS
jgi:hypothetical protein